MRARRLLILLMMLLLLPQAQAERLTLYTRPNNVDEAMPFQLRPTELSICSVTRAMGGVVVLANDNNYDSLSLYFWQDGMTEMRKLGGGFYWVMSSDTMETAQESCEYSMSRVPNYRMPDLTHAISNLTSDGETLYALNRINGLIFKISETKDGLQTEDVCTMANLSCLNVSYRDLETDKVYTYPASLTRMHVCGSVLAISVMQENGIKVVLVDLADGAIREIAGESLEAMYEWADGELLLWRLEGSPNEISRSSGTYTLSRYSVATGEETLLSTGVPYKKRSECGAYDPYSGSYYDVRTRQIVRTTDFVQEEPVVTLPGSERGYCGHKRQHRRCEPEQRLRPLEGKRRYDRAAHPKQQRRKQHRPAALRGGKSGGDSGAGDADEERYECGELGGAHECLRRCAGHPAPGADAGYA